MTSLPTLIKRLEEAEGPSRELDALIAALLEPHRFDAPGFTPIRPIPAFRYESGENIIRFEGGGIMDVRFFPPVTSSVDAAIALAERVLPGWMRKVGTCSVSDDAWVAPDFNSPVHGERLKRELDHSSMKAGDPLDIGFDIDQRPPGREAIALCRAILSAFHHVSKGSP